MFLLLLDDLLFYSFFFSSTDFCLCFLDSWLLLLRPFIRHFIREFTWETLRDETLSFRSCCRFLLILFSLFFVITVSCRWKQLRKKRVTDIFLKAWSIEMMRKRKWIQRRRQWNSCKSWNDQNIVFCEDCLFFERPFFASGAKKMCDSLLMSLSLVHSLAKTKTREECW